MRGTQQGTKREGDTLPLPPNQGTSMQTEFALSLSLENLLASRAPLFHPYPREVNPEGAWTWIGSPKG